ncbi:MAG: phosphoribosylformylglycinamidine synthase, partial [Desulfobacterales bacterium SG8_35]
MHIRHLYRKVNHAMEFCFNIEAEGPLTDEEISRLQLLLADGFIKETVSTRSYFEAAEKEVVELGPRLNFATAWSSNMVSICHATGLKKIRRMERSRRYLVTDTVDRKEFIAGNHDRMTECLYPEPLATFETGIAPEGAYEVPLMEKGAAALQEIPGISMDEWDRNFYYDYFVNKHKRNPTIVEIMDLNNANSEHSRHGFFRGRHVIDGREEPETLMEIVRSTLEANATNSIIAFKDNSSGIRGRDIFTVLPDNPGSPSPFSKRKLPYHVIFTAETHNFPT